MWHYVKHVQHQSEVGEVTTAVEDIMLMVPKTAHHLQLQGKSTNLKLTEDLC